MLRSTVLSLKSSHTCTHSKSFCCRCGLWLLNQAIWSMFAVVSKKTKKKNSKPFCALQSKMKLSPKVRYISLASVVYLPIDDQGKSSEVWYVWGLCWLLCPFACVPSGLLFSKTLFYVNSKKKHQTWTTNIYGIIARRIHNIFPKINPFLSKYGFIMRLLYGVLPRQQQRLILLI